MIFARKWSRLLFKKKNTRGQRKLNQVYNENKASQLVLFHKPLTRNIFLNSSKGMF